MLLLFVCALALAGCGSASQGGESIAPVPVVDIAHAREAFEAGGELTYEELVALRREIVGDYPERGTFEDFNKYNQALLEFRAREQDYHAKFEECRLKETGGWVAFWSQEYDMKTYEDIRDKNRLAVYVYNPFDGVGKELRGYPEIFLGYLTDKEIAQLKYGQRITFSGDLFLLGSDVAVQNPKYSLLEDGPEVPRPSAYELKGLRITLERSMCYGRCPDYTLTIKADGTVTFEGRNFTQIKGTATSTIDNEKLTELATEIKKADFFSLDSYYTANVTDVATYKLTVWMGGREKQVETHATRPRRLDILMDRIDQIVDSGQWIGDPSEP